MRAQGVRSLSVSCWLCHHGAVLAVDRWPDEVHVPSFGPRMVCSGCGIVGADARPNWTEQPSLPSLTGHPVKRLMGFAAPMCQDARSRAACVLPD
jgi:hypothetical protein